MAAFELALEHGCDGFEFDVRLSADHRSIICHDRAFRGREVSRTIRDQLTALASLSDVVATFASRAVLDIELKVPGPEAEVARLLRQHPPARGCCVSSFLPEVVEQLHRVDGSLPLGLICDTGRQLARWSTLPVGALFLERGLVNAAVVDQLHAAGKKVFVWTVDKESEMRSFAALGVDGLISDDTQLLARTFPP